MKFCVRPISLISINFSSLELLLHSHSTKPAYCHACSVFKQEITIAASDGSRSPWEQCFTRVWITVWRRSGESAHYVGMGVERTSVPDLPHQLTKTGLLRWHLLLAACLSTKHLKMQGSRLRPNGCILRPKISQPATCVYNEQANYWHVLYWHVLPTFR